MPAALAAGLFATLAAWVSQGTFAFAAIAGPRLTVLPLSAAAILIAVLAGGAVVLLVRAGASPAPLLLLTLVLAPCLPIGLPGALLAWTGSLKLLLWAGMWLMMLHDVARQRNSRRIVPSMIAAFTTVRPRTTAGLAAAVLLSAAAWAAAPSVPGADEPHYLVITQSLLLDGDLRIENNHRRGDYRSYFSETLSPHYLRRGRDGEIYSIHAPGLSVLVAPAFAIGGYRGTVIFLIALASLGSALLWHVAWLATRSAGAAWFGWASVLLSATTIFHSFTVFPDGLGGLLTLTGVWALLRARDEQRSGTSSVRPWFAHGAMLALLPWLHTRFALLSGSLGALVLLRLSATKNPAAKGVAFLVTPALSALCWIGYFIAIYGTPDPSAPYAGSDDFSASFIPGGLAGLLFDQRFGLFATAPVLLCAMAGFVLMIAMPHRVRTQTEDSPRSLALELLFVTVPYLLTVSNFAMWWGGRSAPARFAAAVLPALVVPAACAWAAMRTRASRITAMLGLAVTLFISSVLIIPQRGRLAFNSRDTYAFWLDWISPVADLGQGLPAWFRGRENEFFLDIVVFAALALGTWWGLTIVERSGRARSSQFFAPLAWLAYAASFMLAVTITWILHGVEGVYPAPAQVALLREVATVPRAVAFQVNPPARLALQDVPSLLRIEQGGRFIPSGGAGRGDRPLLSLPAVPAGRYRVRVRTRARDGRVMVGIGPDQFSLKAVQVGSPPDPIEIDFPVDVRALVVRGDEAARQAIRSLVVEPISVLRPAERLSAGVARQAARYRDASFFFLDACSFPETETIWIGGGCAASLVIQPDAQRTTLVLSLRNAPVANVVTIDAGAWRTRLPLGPEEEGVVQVPLNPGAPATLIRIATATGFRPSEIDQTSRDTRFLGVSIKP